MIDYARANNGPNSSYHNSVLFVEITLKAKTLANTNKLMLCKARVCNACAKEVVAIVTCPFCGGDPSPVDCSNDARSPSPVDCSNDAAIALALSRSWA